MKEIRLKSPAKINLGLRVLRKRKDGYHEIETVLQMIKLFDEISIREKGGDIKVFCDDKTLNGRANLAYKAAELIKKKSRENREVEIFIRKNIPVGAGLGGGSSNAASVLLGLNRLWRLGYGKDQLMEMAGLLGSDVPFFINGPTAFARGRGEILTPLKKTEKMFLVLIVPSLPISTEWAYKNLNLKLTKNHRDSNLNNLGLSRITADTIKDCLINDFEEVVKKRLPEIGEIKERLLALGSKGCSMSGSGSSVYGIFKEKEKALFASKKLRAEGDWKIILTETITDKKELDGEDS